MGRRHRSFFRRASGGRPGDYNAARPDRSERRSLIVIPISPVEVLRRPLESAHQELETMKRRMKDEAFIIARIINSVAFQSKALADR